MKKYIFPVLAAASMAFTSCNDHLDIPQKGAIDIFDYYQNDGDCQKALASAYEGFLINVFGRTELDGGPGIYTPARVLANHPGDDICYGGGNYGDHEFGGDINEFRLSSEAEAVNFHYRGLYLSVYTCNCVIDKFKEGKTDFQKQAVAEARVLRAYDYFLLACYWGTPPIIDGLKEGNYVPTNSDLQENPMSQKDIFNWVAEECLTAVPDLISRNGKTDKDGAVRVTKGFANALAGKAYLFAENWKAAKDALYEVIKSKNYDLVPGERYADLFHVEGDGCEEKVFELNLEFNPAISDWGGATWNGAIHHSTWMEANCFNWRAGNFVTNPGKAYCGIDGWGSIGVPQWFGDEFYNNDGDKSYRLKATIMHIDDAVYMTSGVKGMQYNDEKLQKMTKAELENSKEVGINDITQGLYGQSFWLPFKNILRKNDCMKQDGSGYGNGDNNRWNNIIVMRYAEVLLNYAEACIMTNDLNEAHTYIKAIQDRAGSKTNTGEATMDVLKREKSYELWFEGCRFQDVLRWKDATAIARLEKAGTATPHLFDKLFRAPKSDDVNIIWEHGTEAKSRFYMVHTHEAMDNGKVVGFKKGKHELFPFPATVVMQNPSIRQNAGY